MALAFDVASSSSGSSVTSLSWSHTCTGSNLVLFVTAQVYDDTSAAERAIASISYNSVAMTKVNRTETGNIGAEIWYLINPATGPNTIAITCGGNNNFIAAGGMSFTGADQTAPAEANNIGSGFGKTASTAVTTITDNAYVIDSVVKYNTTEAITKGASQTQAHNLSVGAGFGIIGGASYQGPKTPTGSVTMSWTWITTSRDWAQVVVSVKPAAAAGAATHFLSSLGVGT